MIRHYSFQETLTVVSDLTEPELRRYIRAGVIRTITSTEGPVFRDIDIARLGVLVELTQGYALDDEALGLVMSLLDQLNGLRADMRAILDAIAQEPPETRLRLGRAISDGREAPQD